MRAYIRSIVEMAQILLCRLCNSSSPRDCILSLFSQTAMKQRLPGRITDLLDVPVSPKDGLPGYICRKCKRKLERLEKAAEELNTFRSEARATYSSFAKKRSDLKRTKETSSSTGLSPDIVKNRPPSKRLTRRQLDFDNSN